MRLLFAHDHRFQRGSDGEIYSSGSFPASIWPRYLEYFDEVRVLGRDGGDAADVGKLSRSSAPGLSFDLLPDMMSFRRLLFVPKAVTEGMRAAVAQADAVVVRLPSEIGLRVAAIARKLGKPYAIEVVGCAKDGYGNSGFTAARLFAPIAMKRMQHAIARAPLAIYVTSAWLQGRYPTAGQSVAASDVEIVPLTAEEVTRRQTKLVELENGRPPRLGTVASLRMKSKGVQTAIEALGRLRRDGLDLHYSVLGPGDAEPWKQLTSEHGVGDLVSFDGTRDAGAGVRAWLDEIDLHLQPSFQEGLPRATVEAMSRGAACVGSTCGGLPELLRPDDAHTPGDVDALARIIRRIAQSPAAIAESSRYSLDVASRFAPDALAASRSAFFRELRAAAEAAQVRQNGAARVKA